MQYLHCFAKGALSLVCTSLLLSTAMTCGAALTAPLTLEDEGSFFVNGQFINANHPGASVTGPTAPGRIMVNQMYVQYRIPPGKKTLPVILVHGSNHTGMTYETTPDGREGWATYFVRRGSPTYVVDHAGRGRSGFNSTVINQVREQAGANPASLPMVFFGTHERGWANFRIGPAYPTPYPGVQFPLNAVDQYLAQLVPNSETTLEGGSANTVNALAALLDKIGPAVVVVHSQSGIYGLDVVRKRPGLVKALVSIEGGCETFKPDDASGPFAKVPMMTLWGDNSVGAKDTVNGDTRRNACVSAINAIKAAGGRATYTLLPDMGIKGNSHMLMLDRNNLQIADYLLQWIAANTQ